MRLVAGDAKL